MSNALRAAVVAAALAAPLALDLRLRRSEQPLTDAWQDLPVAHRGDTLLGISLRPRQLAALGLDPLSTAAELLAYPFQVVRLSAYWRQMEPTPGAFVPDELDQLVEMAARTGKQIILAVGAVKTFGYPEFFVPDFHQAGAFREGTLVRASEAPHLLEAACRFVTRVVERYRSHRAVIAWQVEHEALDPLGMEHSWRLAEDFVRSEVAAVRAADATRPVLLNGFLANSTLAAATQWLRTRDQGDSLAGAQRLGDLVGVDYYPRHALFSLGHYSLYLDGSRTPWQQRRRRRLAAAVQAQGRRLLVSEGQAEPWEAVTTPPDPQNAAMASCLPEHLIATYNQWLAPSGPGTARLYAYLFWGAEYWVQRRLSGDGRYLAAFERIVSRS